MDKSLTVHTIYVKSQTLQYISYNHVLNDTGIYMYIILHEMQVFRINLILDTAIVKFKFL